MMQSGRTALGLLLALATLPTLGCAGTELVAEARGIRGVVKTARDNGAYRCAPGELALAEAHVEFAEQELSDGDYFRAQDHLHIADWNAREATRLTADPACQARRQANDVDGDGVADATDRCACARPRTGTGSRMGTAAPSRTTTRTASWTVSTSARFCPRIGTASRTATVAPTGTTMAMGSRTPPTNARATGRTRTASRTTMAAAIRTTTRTASWTARTSALPRLACAWPRAARSNFRSSPSPPRRSSCTQTIHFQTARAVILARSYPLLDEVAAALKSRPTMKVRIEGHTDSRGNRQTNLRLSQARASSVKAYLVGAGIDAERLDSQGFGPDQPIETNRTTAGRGRNRRVEFVITSQ